MYAEGLRHHGVKLRFDGQTHLIDFHALIGKSVMVYGQHEVVKDLIAMRLAQRQPLFFETSKLQLHDLTSTSPSVTFEHAGEQHQVHCQFVAGCDGFHGACRPALAQLGAHQFYDKQYPFAWLGILAQAAPTSEELIYAHHPRGFALYSMRSPSITRLYLQCAPLEDLANWPDERIWAELQARLGTHINVGPIVQKSITPMRSFVCEPMQHGRLFLAGDAAHIVPPTGAKGMNLAVADVRILAKALADFYMRSNEQLLKRYSDICLKRVWRVEQFSWWLTSLLHSFEHATPFEQRMQLAGLESVVKSRAASSMLAEQYVGLPLEA
jgi:p-hydroxybenzoate 3-monooxygenase